ncbi:ORC2-domain-containing protein [Nadsonia fulvescens var. elongata DSM 6958]|uniref:ORC2-domain-containing protein n=1 Tax=Nadsonia fulvescens var. elongata DSM 6958 TaxID=857566 RepID=A0A1E3PF39_9ASCO|nr:ORC2-domain-containing protein [Nadsonia fulvescens var. elongata DSM 6958]
MSEHSDKEDVFKTDDIKQTNLLVQTDFDNLPPNEELSKVSLDISTDNPSTAPKKHTEEEPDEVVVASSVTNIPKARGRPKLYGPGESPAEKKLALQQQLGVVRKRGRPRKEDAARVAALLKDNNKDSNDNVTDRNTGDDECNGIGLNERTRLTIPVSPVPVRYKRQCTIKPDTTTELNSPQKRQMNMNEENDGRFSIRVLPTTPSKRRNNGNIMGNLTPSPKKYESPFKTPLASPSKMRPTSPLKFQLGGKGMNDTNKINNELDMSARRKATRRLLGTEDESFDELDYEDNALAEKIIAESQIEQNGEALGTPIQSPFKLSSRNNLDIEGTPPVTSKTIFDLEFEKGALSESTGLFLDGYEGYFEQHAVKGKVSTNSMNNSEMIPLIEYPEFIENIKKTSQQHHIQERALLQSAYSIMFTQWQFELTQGFSLIFYGVGSKRKLLHQFIETRIQSDIPVLVINGYNDSLRIKEVIHHVASVLLEDLIKEDPNVKLPGHPQDLLNYIVRYVLATHDGEAGGDSKKPSLVLMIHNIDAPALRTERIQMYLSRLASLASVWVVVSIDNITAPVLWDAAKISQFNFIWHDTTTFEPYLTETSFREDTLSLGRKERFGGAINGVQGVRFVLESLTSNARGIYRVLVCRQLENMMEGDEDSNNMDNMELNDKPLSRENHATASSNITNLVSYGVEFKRLYQQCAEEFLVSNEINFKTILGEFVEHRMANITKNSTGGLSEVVWAPFNNDVLQQIVEEMLN